VKSQNETHFNIEMVLNGGDKFEVEQSMKLMIRLDNPKYIVSLKKDNSLRFSFLQRIYN